MSRAIELPMTREVASELRAGDEVMLSGPVLTGRDQACARLHQMIQDGLPLPVDLDGQVLYFVGPSPPPPEKVIGAAGPTTSGRMDPFLPAILACGLRGIIGKGYLAQEVKNALAEHKAVYFGAIGGTGALLSSTIQEVRVLAFEDLLSEAIRLMSVKEFPAVVLHDIYGGDLYAKAVRGPTHVR